jgi:5-(carboxyamino)imidazole ribonucleotide mutase
MRRREQVKKEPVSHGILKVAVVMGSDSDFPLMKECIKTLKDFGMDYEVMVCSAHRTPDKAVEFAKNAENTGFGVIIAAAGKAAHLPGVIASHTLLPVIGIPVKTSTFNGMDALLSIVQMPQGIPVAAVAVDGAVNAALLAIEILSVGNKDIRGKMALYREQLALNIEEKNIELQKKIQEI